MQSDILMVMKETFQAFGIQTVFLKPPYNNVSDIDLGLANQMYMDYNYDQVMEEIEKISEPNKIYMTKNPLYMCHTFFAFPEHITQEYGYTYCVIGPMVFEPVSQMEFAQIMEDYSIDEKYSRDLQVFFTRIPEFQSYERWCSLVVSFCKRISNEEVQLVHDQSLDFSKLNNVMKKHMNQEEPDFTTDTIEKRYAAENRMLNAIKKGDYTDAMVRMNELLQYQLLPRTNDSVRDKKNLMLVLNTLLRKSIEQVKVHPVYIDELSRKFAIQIENMTSINQLDVVRVEMIHKYCLLVNNFSRSGYSDMIRQCMDYVDFHYMEELSLAKLAEQYFVSNTHLSAVFKKEVGINLKEYIQEVRLRQARLQLNTTRLPIQEIAGNCGFLDVNYFSRVFRKLHGMSPREYRAKIREGKHQLKI